jgi:hypothetical protein
MNKRHTVLVQENELGEQFIEFPEEMIKEANWKEGDDLKWTDNKDGTWTLSKVDKDKVWVMVECISMFRQRYMVQAPIDHPEYALDTVTMNEAKEFSQLHLGETIVSHRVMTEEQALELSDEDNAYLKDWTDEMKIQNLFTQKSDIINK